MCVYNNYISTRYLLNQRNSEVLLGVSRVVDDAADVDTVVALGVVDAVGRPPARPRMLSISSVNTLVSS